MTEETTISIEGGIAQVNGSKVPRNWIRDEEVMKLRPWGGGDGARDRTVGSHLQIETRLNPQMNVSRFLSYWAILCPAQASFALHYS